MSYGKKLYEGKAKILYTLDGGDVAVYFKDDATAFNGEKKGTIKDKGTINSRLTELFFTYLETNGVPTQHVGRMDERTLKARRLEMIPLEVVVRNVAAGSMAKRLGIEEGRALKRPIVEFYLKDDALGDPLLTDAHIAMLELASEEDLSTLRAMALQIDDLLVRFYAERGIRLVDFKLEFGRSEGKILLADEITPDTCRLWDMKTGAKLDKDRFRQDLGGVDEAYAEVLERVGHDGL